MPEGMYLDGLELGPTKLGKEITKIISNREHYYGMFKWHNHYSFHNPLHNSDTNGVCQLCATINNDHERLKITVYKNIVKWFNDRKDWDVWNTRRINIPQFFYDQPNTRKSSWKHARNKHIISSYSDSNMSENDKSDSDRYTQLRTGDIDKSKSDKSDRDRIITMLADDDDDEDDDSEIISLDENNLYINDFVTVSNKETVTSIILLVGEVFLFIITIKNLFYLILIYRNFFD